MSPLCSSCRSDAEVTTTGGTVTVFGGQEVSRGKPAPDKTCSRCGERCDNCNEFTSSNATRPTLGMNIDWRGALATLLGIVCGVLCGIVVGGVIF